MERHSSRRPANVSLKRRMAGITLLELMAVVMIIGVLAAVALPSYRQYEIRAQRTEAKSALLQLATNEERWYLQNNTYSNDPTVLGFATGKTENGAYQLSVASADLRTTYKATATPVSGGSIDMTADTDCAAFSLDSQGVKSVSGTLPVERCW
jgi:type IV pilus assembly protein PilE